MAKVHGVAGEWARVNGMVTGMWPLFLGVFAVGFSSAAMMVSPMWGFVALILAFVYCAWSLRKGMRHAERFFKGARGEEHVSDILKSLPERYHIFNDFVACGTHVDHVVVGPAGIFAIETKCWMGRVTLEEGHILINGQMPDRAPLAQVLREASRVKTQLAKLGWKGDVTPVLTFASDTFDAKIAELSGAVIINSDQLRSSFNTERMVIPPAELERLINIMENNQ